jgi:hypothetical protein
MGQIRSDERIAGGIFIGAVFGVFTVIFVIFVTSMFCSKSKIDPETTYKVFDVTDGTGNTHRNLKRFDGSTFVDHHRNLYSFHGNYTVISRNVSGEELLKEAGVEKEER